MRITSIQKVAARKFSQAPWDKKLAAWLLDDRLPQKKFSKLSVPGNDFCTVIDGSASVRVRPLPRASEALQKKFSQMYQADDRMGWFFLSRNQNCTIVEITAHTRARVAWRGQTETLGAVLFVCRGEVEIIERAPFLMQYIMIDAAAQSRISYFFAQRPRAACTYYSYQARAGRGSGVEWVGALQVKEVCVTHICTIGSGAGSSLQQTVGARVSQSGRLWLTLTHDHRRPQQTGKIKFRGLGKDQARGLVMGMIKIAKPAAYANSYLSEDALLTSPQAAISALPDLEILNNEVKASHGATVGRLDELALYYLTTRGLSLPEARRLLISGFFQTLGSTIKDERLRQAFVRVLL